MTTAWNGFTVGQTVRVLRPYRDQAHDPLNVRDGVGTLIRIDAFDPALPYRVKIEGHADRYVSTDGVWVYSIGDVDAATDEVSVDIVVGTRVVVTQTEQDGDSSEYDGQHGEVVELDPDDDEYPFRVFLDRGQHSKWVHSVRRENQGDGLSVGDTVTYQGTRTEYQGHQGTITSLSDQFAQVSVTVNGVSHSVRVARTNLLKVEGSITSTEEWIEVPGTTPVTNDRVRYLNRDGGRDDWNGREGILRVRRDDRYRGVVTTDDGGEFRCKIVNLTKLVRSNERGEAVTTFNEGDEVKITGMNGTYPPELEGETATYIRGTSETVHPHYVRVTSGSHTGHTMYVYSVEKIVSSTSVAGKTAEHVQAEFDAFRRRVVEEARRAARPHNFCGEIDILLKEKLGLAEFYPSVKKATVTIELDETETASLLAGGLETANGTRIRAWLRDNVIRSASARAEITETPITRVAVR